MRSIQRRIAAAGGMLLLAAACGRAPDAQPRPGARADTIPAVSAAGSLRETEWVLVSLRGARPLPNPPITLSFEDSAFGGYGGCNWMGGRYAAGRDTLRTWDVSQTLRGCAGPIQDQEERFVRTLGDVRRYGITGDTLRLRNAPGEVVLEFVRRRRAAMDPAALRGTRWRLVAMGDRAPLPDARITIAFSADSIRGHAGCRDYTGSYAATGHRLRVTSLAMNGTECRREPLWAQEGDFTNALSETTDFQLEGRVLRLLTVSGGVLRFEREEGGDTRSG